MVGSAGGPLRERAINMFIGFTIKKKMVVATNKKEMMALMRWPIMNLLSLIVK